VEFNFVRVEKLLIFDSRLQ